MKRSMLLLGMLAAAPVLVLAFAASESRTASSGSGQTADRPAEAAARVTLTEADRAEQPEALPARPSLARSVAASDREAPTGRFGPEVICEGRTAQLTGTILAAGGGIGARIEFTAGPNRGVVIQASGDGSFESEALYPGFQMVQVSAADTANPNSWGWTCSREVLLRHRNVDSFDLAFGDYGTVRGKVLDDVGEPLFNAQVSVDGRVTHSAGNGSFELARTADGESLLVVRAKGFAAYQEHLVEPSSALSNRPTEVRLDRGCNLDLTVGGAPGTGEVEVYLLPRGGQRMSGRMPRAAYPWQRVNPVRVAAGTTLRLTDLPRTKVDVIAIHPLAKGATFAWLAEDRTARILLDLEPVESLEVRVVRGEQPVPGVQVRLHFANGMKATQAALGDAGKFYRSQPFEIVPLARQQTATDSAGVAFVGRDPSIRVSAFVTVTAAEGDIEVTREIERGRTTIEIDLDRPAQSIP